jgi:hypothetical protein
MKLTEFGAMPLDQLNFQGELENRIRGMLTSEGPACAAPTGNRTSVGSTHGNLNGVWTPIWIRLLPHCASKPTSNWRTILDCGLGCRRWERHSSSTTPAYRTSQSRGLLGFAL